MNYKIIIAFITMCFAWGFSWIAVRMQTKSMVPVEISLFYRFLATSILIFFLAKITKHRLKCSKQEIQYLAIIGATNFSLNFLLIYYAVKYIASGIAAVIFSLSIIISEVIGGIINKKDISRKIIISSIVGTIGLATFVAPLVNFGNQQYINNIKGILISFMAVVIYSFGNVIVAKNKKMHNTPLYSLIAYSSSFGAILILVINFIKIITNSIFSNVHQNLSLGIIDNIVMANSKINFIDYSASYISSLSYLIFIATIIAFICLFYLVQNIGSARANYTSLIYPVIALITSAFFENFYFTITGFIGLLLIIIAIIIEFFYKSKKLYQTQNI